MMMKTVKHTFNALGDRTGDFARTTGDFARNLGGDTVDLARRFGGDTADLARRFGDGTATLAKRIGPKRGLIGLAVLAAAVGGSIMLVRYLRARDARNAADADGADETPRNGFANKRSRAKNAAEPYISHQ